MRAQYMDSFRIHRNGMGNILQYTTFNFAYGAGRIVDPDIRCALLRMKPCKGGFRPLNGR